MPANPNRPRPERVAGQQLQDRRRARGLARRTVAAALNVTEATYRSWEAGYVAVPDEYRDDLEAILRGPEPPGDRLRGRW